MSDAYVWIDPARKSGEPCIGGHRLSVELVIESVWYGDVHTAMATYELSRGQVLTACWFAGAGNVVRLHGKGGKYVAHRGPWRKRWAAWASEVHQALWQSTTVDYDQIPDPPTVTAWATTTETATETATETVVVTEIDLTEAEETGS